MVTEIDWNGSPTSRFRATVLYHSKCHEKVWSRGGTNGVFVYNYEGRDATTVVVTLPVKNTLAQALTVHRALPAGVGLGLVTTPKGFALRCKPEHRDAIAATARPEEALAYGDLFALKREDCQLYMVYGVDGMITGPVLHNSLQRSIGWLAKPIKPAKSNSWGCRDWHVWAKVAPRTQIVRLTTNEGRAMNCEIAKVEPRERKSAWDVAAGPSVQRPTYYADKGDGGDDNDTTRQYDGDWSAVEPDDWDPTAGLGAEAKPSPSWADANGYGGYK